MVVTSMAGCGRSALDSFDLHQHDDATSTDTDAAPAVTDTGGTSGGDSGMTNGLPGDTAGSSAGSTGPGPDPSAESSGDPSDGGTSTATSGDPPDGESTTTGVDPGTTGDAGTSGAETTAEPGVCGDGVMDPGEECDTQDFGGMSCQDYGFVAGPLQCTEACTIDTSACINPGPP